MLVVDNGSTDDSVAVARELGAEVLTLPGNFGFAFAVNRGIEKTVSDHIAIVNNDVVLRPDWLEKLLRADAPFACGKLVREGDPDVLDGTFDLLARGGLAWRAGNGRLADEPAWNEGREIQFAPMTAALFRRQVFGAVGLLDESFGSYLEDVDFGLRCGLAGIQGRYVPAAVGSHRGSATFGVWRGETVRLLSRNQALLIRKHYPARLVWRYACSVFGGQSLWGLLALRHGCGFAWLRGKWQGLRAVPGLVAPSYEKLETILSKSETELLHFQQLHSADRFWRLYAWLT